MSGLNDQRVSLLEKSNFSAFARLFMFLFYENSSFHFLSAIHTWEINIGDWHIQWDAWKYVHTAVHSDFEISKRCLFKAAWPSYSIHCISYSRKIFAAHKYWQLWAHSHAHSCPSNDNQNKFVCSVGPAPYLQHNETREHLLFGFNFSTDRKSLNVWHPFEGLYSLFTTKSPS